MSNDVWEYEVNGEFRDEIHTDNAFKNWEKELVEDAAKLYTEKTDLDYSEWPASIELFLNGESRGAYIVEMDYSPNFYASEKKVNNE